MFWLILRQKLSYPLTFIKEGFQSYTFFVSVEHCNFAILLAVKITGLAERARFFRRTHAALKLRFL